MRSTRAAEQALRSARLPHSQNYICRACRAQASRQFHTTPTNFADVPFYQRLRDTLFGSKESEQAEKSRAEKQARKLDELNGRDDNGTEVKVGRGGQQYEVAAVIVPSENQDYVPARTWDGLERVGSEEWVAARADQGEQYVGFVPKKRVELSNRGWQMLLHHILVEILVLQKARRPVGEVCNSHARRRDTKSVEIKLNKKGTTFKAVFLGDAEAAVLKAIPEQPLEGQEQDHLAVVSGIKAVAEADTSGSSPLPPWMQFSVEDRSVKIALLKRIVQLTGTRLPDSAINSSSTLANLFKNLRAKEKPKKLAQAPQMQRLKLTAPNVSVFSSRRTPIHKEKAIGRWKVIEEELARRDLPVTGSRWQGAKTRAE